jgi:hypothetical protein
MQSIWLECVALTALIGAPSGVSPPPIRETFAVIGFTRGKSLKDSGWKEKVYNSPIAWEVVQGEDGPVLHGTSDGSASMLYKDIAYDAKQYPLLGWEWKVLRLPRKGEENTQANNDYGARLYIFFPGWTFLTSYVLEYVWDNETPAGTIKTSSSSGKCKLVVVNSGNADLGEWVTVKRNLRDDFTNAFGWEPDRPVGGIGFMTDSDNTSSSTEAYYGPVSIGR